MLGSYTRGFTVTKLLFVGGAGWGGWGRELPNPPPYSQTSTKNNLDRAKALPL